MHYKWMSCCAFALAGSMAMGCGDSPGGTEESIAELRRYKGSTRGGDAGPGAKGNASTDAGAATSSQAATDGGRTPDPTGTANAHPSSPPPPPGSTFPFNSASPWNTKVPGNPALEPNSKELVDDLRTSSPWGEHLDVNISGYSIPLVWADGTTPQYEVFAEVGGAGWTGENGMHARGMMPIPNGAQPDHESDHHLLVVDRQRGIEWGCWAMENRDGKWQAGLCATADLTGTGVRPSTVGNPTWYTSHGARACGFPLIAGLIRVDEVKAGRIDHALVVAYPHIRAGWYTPPASTAQAFNGTAISTRGIPCGGHVQLDPATDISNLKGAARMIAQALKDYGAFVGDFSGAISLYAENSPDAKAYWASGVLDSYDLKDKLDMSHLRVLKLGQQYDNGNGN